jgi:hypothetical protein
MCSEGCKCGEVHQGAGSQVAQARAEATLLFDALQSAAHAHKSMCEDSAMLYMQYLAAKVDHIRFLLR